MHDGRRIHRQRNGFLRRQNHQAGGRHEHHQCQRQYTQKIAAQPVHQQHKGNEHHLHHHLLKQHLEAGTGKGFLQRGRRLAPFGGEFQNQKTVAGNTGQNHQRKQQHEWQRGNRGHAEHRPGGHHKNADHHQTVRLEWIAEELTQDFPERPGDIGTAQILQLVATQVTVRLPQTTAGFAAIDTTLAIGDVGSRVVPQGGLEGMKLAVLASHRNSLIAGR